MHPEAGPAPSLAAEASSGRRWWCLASIVCCSGLRPACGDCDLAGQHWWAGPVSDTRKCRPLTSLSRRDPWRHSKCTDPRADDALRVAGKQNGSRWVGLGPGIDICKFLDLMDGRCTITITACPCQIFSASDSLYGCANETAWIPAMGNVSGRTGPSFLSGVVHFQASGSSTATPPHLYFFPHWAPAFIRSPQEWDFFCSRRT